MFQVTDGSKLQQQIASAESNYVIQTNDYLNIQVFTNNGERLIDPDFQLIQGTAVGSNMTAVKPTLQYLVNQEGIVKLPMIEEIKLEGLTLRQAEEILQKEYSKYYQGAYVHLQYLNKRVVVLGAPGGQVIPLENNNITLVEILALAKGIGNDAMANNIRVLRGDEVILADFSTFEGYTKANIVMSPGDVVYVEPIRRPFAESIRDYGPLLTILASLTTLIVVIVGI